MRRLAELRLPLDHPPAAMREAVLDRLALSDADLLSITVIRRGIDARQAPRISLVYSLNLELSAVADATTPLPLAPDTRYRPVAHAPMAGGPRPVVVGAGPCGLMAALILAQSGFRPIILERGKAVRERTADTFRFWRQGILDDGSNVQFGEGGAGTFSDGKLYSQIRDRKHYGRKVLEEFVRAGAPEEILSVSKPHIGTFRLVSMVEHIRRSLTELGAEYRFGHAVTGLDVQAGRLRALIVNGSERVPCSHAIFAPGHSARDSFEMLVGSGVELATKPFSIGVRIEHPQRLIDAMRYRDDRTATLLGAADYRLSHLCANGRTAYSFCMCPGGTVVAAASEHGHVVTNGMSQYSRAERNANAGLVVNTVESDFPGGPMAAIAFQRHWERQAFLAGGSDYAAPAQRLEDFLAGRPSSDLGHVTPSYRPAVKPANLLDCLPGFAVAAMQEAIVAFDRMMPGYAMPDAVLTGVETRTSSPLRIPRLQSGHSPDVQGLFPAGEGAGYAGGILSAAIDGIRVAEAVALDVAGRGSEARLRTGSGSYGHAEHAA